MKRAIFATHGKETRFLLSDDGASVLAEVVHVDLHMVRHEVDKRAAWHSAGRVPVRDLQVAAGVKTVVLFKSTSGCVHGVYVGPPHLAQLLVALDAWHEGDRSPKEIAS